MFNKIEPFLPPKMSTISASFVTVKSTLSTTVFDGTGLEL